ncbi:MAG: 2-C-methyl-D-erythritol 4-phosphate cytidylyltransferase [Candidatus Omnitrophica bacterium]|nr:2-C-methyl-D-erythritol 4-phosphate cytidylyltransferase [Candidatus Omnitrophota bacterium]
MNIAAIIVCAGSGRRLGKTDKTTLSLSAKPLFYHSFCLFAGIKQIKNIVLVMQDKHISLAKKLISPYKAKKLGVFFVKGGPRRQDSVKNGLGFLGDDIDYVLIHDGARPLASRKLVLNIIKELKKNQAVICALKPRDTLKFVGKKGYARKTLDRDKIVSVQTPQAFRKELILRAFDKRGKKYLFDDAQAVESLGVKVKVIEGERTNIKITYPEDVEIAKAIIGCRVKG